MRFKYDILKEALVHAGTYTELQIQFLKQHELEQLAQFTKLRSLYIYFCQVQPTPIEHMPHLKELEIGMWCMDTVDFSIAHNPELEVLGIFEGTEEVNRVQLDLSHNTKLKELVFTDLEAPELPQGIGQLHNLHELELGGNQLTQLDFALPEVLKRIDIRQNKITHLPQSWQLPQLEEALIGYNPLHDIGGIRHSTALLKLDLRETALSPQEKANIQAALPNCEVLV